VGAFNTVGALGPNSLRGLPANLELLSRSRGYVYPSYFAKLIPHLDNNVDDRLRTLLRFKESSPRLLREGIAAELFRRKHGDGVSLLEDYEAAVEAIERVDPGAFQSYARGFGPLLIDWLGGDLRGALIQLEAAQGDSPLLAEALGRTGSGFRPRGGEPTLAGVEAMLIADLAAVEGAPLDLFFARGVGWRLHWILHRTVLQPWRAEAVIATAPGVLGESLRAGYEEARQQGLIGSQL
jgi:hypothetical protein